jgi:glycosyltransferase involved in cell wall biosynthesis
MVTSVLHVFPTLDNGGVEKFLLNYYEHMDRDLIRFDFVVLGTKKGIFEDLFLSLGSCVYHITPFSTNPFKTFNEMLHILSSNRYDILHCHGYGFKSLFALSLAKIMGIHVRILHSHMVTPEGGLRKKAKRIFVTYFSKMFANYWWACGVDAAKWLFGRSAVKQNRVTIVPNAIQVSDFKFNEADRKKVRSGLGVDKGTIVLGCVGRITDQKNQKFLIDVMNNLKGSSQKFLLCLVGSGDLDEYISKTIKEFRMQNNIKMLGARNNVNELLSGFDVFVLPSKFEGFPVSLVEAQMNGLDCLVSDKITTEVNFTGHINYLSIDDGSQLWSNALLKSANRGRLIRYSANSEKYDISYQGKKLQQLYVTISI